MRHAHSLLALGLIALFVLVWHTGIPANQVQGLATLDAYAPAVDPRDSSEYLQLTITTEAAGPKVAIRASGPQKYFYKDAYYLSESNTWKKFALFSQGNWSWENATITLRNATLHDLPTQGAILIYACKKYGSTSYICGTKTASGAQSARYWTIKEYGGCTGCMQNIKLQDIQSSDGKVTLLLCKESDAALSGSGDLTFTGEKTYNYQFGLWNLATCGGSNQYGISAEYSQVFNAPADGQTKSITISGSFPSAVNNKSSDDSITKTITLHTLTCDTCTSAGATRCSGTQVQTCTDGCWSTPTNCPGTGQSCQNDVCIATCDVCSPGAQQCFASVGGYPAGWGDRLGTCQTVNGCDVWTYEYCDCRNNACVTSTPMCTDRAGQFCTSSQPANSARNSTATCTTIGSCYYCSQGYTYQNGACVSAQPACTTRPGQFCSSTQPSNSVQNTSASCSSGSCYSCSTSYTYQNGACVAQTQNLKVDKFSYAASASEFDYSICKSTSAALSGSASLSIAATGNTPYQRSLTLDSYWTQCPTGGDDFVSLSQVIPNPTPDQAYTLTLQASFPSAQNSDTSDDTKSIQGLVFSTQRRYEGSSKGTVWTNRTNVGDQSKVCSPSQCVDGSTCYFAGQQLSSRWACADTGAGAAFYFCSWQNNGKRLGTTNLYCCPTGDTSLPYTFKSGAC